MTRKFLRIKPMTEKQLRDNNRFFAIIMAVGVFFLLRDFFFSAAKDIPVMGITGYLAGPIFAHKISELIVAAGWLSAAWMFNHENAGIWPKFMPPQRYLRLLRVLHALMLVALVLATYAWTVINLGTSPLTTNFEPFSTRPDGAVWRYYLGALVLAAALYVAWASRKICAMEKNNQTA